MILPAHYQEWLDSTVSRDLINLNVKSLANFEPYDYLLYALPDSDRRNDGRLRDNILRRYSHLAFGGWWVSGVDLLTGEDSYWGQFKPDRPYYREEKPKGFDSLSQAKRVTAKNKIIKYEPPKNVPTEVFALKMPLYLWQAIALRFDVPLPEKIAVTSDGRALGFWAWVIANPKIPLIITEGAKKAGALLTAGYVAIALPGIYNGYRQPKNDWGQKIGNPHLIPQLEALAQKGREIIFGFDNDTKLKTVLNVRSAIAKTGKLFERRGCSASIITWNTTDKGVDDLIANKGVDYFHALYKNRIPLAKFQLTSLLDLSKYSPLYVNERYLGKNSLPPHQAQLIGFKSAKGTGKTELLADIAARATRTGQKVIIICHREQLAIALANRFGIDYRTEVRTSVTKGALGYALCVDSLHPQANPPFKPEEWQGALVIIDEVEQVLWHMLNSSTCASNRIAIIDNFHQLLLTAVGTGGKVYLADADLSPIALDYVRSLIDYSVETWVVENQYKRGMRSSASPGGDLQGTGDPNRGRRKLVTYSGNDPRSLVADLVNHISRGQRVLIHTTGQKARSKWGSINLESYLSKLFPHLKILRIDSESVAEPGHKAYGCMGNLNAILTRYDIAIASPVMETGVSIDIKGHFDSVWCIAQGVQTVDAVCQAVERLREDIPRHLWVKTTAKGNRIGNGSTSIRVLLASEQKLARANISLLQIASIEDFNDLDFNYSPKSLHTWAKRACVVNAGKNNYRAEIIEKLIAEGYDWSLSDEADEESVEQSKIISANLQQTRSENYQKFNDNVAKVATPTDSELNLLINKKAKTQEERYKERKGNLIKRYGVEVTPKLIERDDRGWYSQLQLHYYLNIGNIYLAQRDKQSLVTIKQQGNGRAFLVDINKKQLSVQIAALKVLNIEQFLHSEAEFSQDSLQNWFNFVIQQRFEIKAILGVSINPEGDTAIAVAQRLLKKLGLRLKFKCWRGSRRSKQRIYQGCDVNADNRNQIFEQWLAQSTIFESKK